ncbi:MAG: T9SS type A sorting domain-containing protein [Bacteroidia bacterium]|nr:T9SS type A sorting domain-containing protein [Bacteroidia bacterium]MBP9725047.1 T9SS type A sorting domain-containing protein [Bacteroidia bacterium]
MKQLFTFIIALFSITTMAQVTGDFRSKQSGSWNTVSTWEVFDAGNLQWNNATSVPTSSNSVWIQDGDSVVLTANAVCKDLHLNSDIAQGDVGRINTQSFRLSISGKIRAYTATKNTIPGTAVSNAHNSSAFITTGTGGKIQFVGTTREVMVSGEWASPANNYGWSLEFAMNSATDTAKIDANLRAGSITIASGVVQQLSGGPKPDNGSAGTGTFTINSGATYISSATGLFRTATDKFGTFTLNTGGFYVVPSSYSASPILAAGALILNGTVVTMNGFLPSTGGLAGADSAETFTNLTLRSNFSLTYNISINGVLGLTANNQLNLNGNTITYGPNSLVEYAGSTSQTTSDTELPLTGGPSGISINNPSGVNLHASRTYKTLRMVQGTLNLGANIFTYAANGTLEYMGTSAQTTANLEFPASNGPVNLTIGNPAHVTLHAARTISGQLKFLSGKLITTSTNLLTLGANASTSGADTTRYVDGPLANIVASSSLTSLQFPVGKAANFRPVSLNITQDAATPTTYTVELFNATPPSRTLPSTLQSVSSSRYWSVTKGTGANVTAASITGQYYNNFNANDNVDDTSLVRIARENGSNWDDLGGTGSKPNYGSVTSTVNFTSLGNFVMAKATPAGSLYPYPIVSIDSLQYVIAQKLGAANTLPDYVNPTFKNSVYRDTVQVEGIVSFDPRYYGLSFNRRATFIQNAAGGAWSGIEIMCDPTTVSGWSGGLTTYKNATQFNQNSVPGLRVRYVCILKNFNGSGATTSGETQLNILPYPAEIVDLNPVSITPTVVTIDKFMKSDGAGGQTIQHTTGEPYEGVYVQFNNVTVVDRTGPNNNRWNWSIQDQSGNKIATYDFSAYFRNDHREDTVGTGATTTPTFTPPNIGVTLSYIRGVITETFNTGSGTWQYVFSPLTPTDLGPALAQAPVVSNRKRTPVVANSTTPVVVTARITDDSTVVSATLNYAVGINTTSFTSVPMTMASGTASDGVWTGTIPAQANGSIVKYFIRGTDNGGRSGFSPDSLATNSAYMVVDGGVTSIQQIQMSPYSNGNSIWMNDTLTNVSIKGIVTATSKTSDLGLVTIQDGNNPNSGIFVTAGVGDGIDQWNRGDSVVINSCVVRENFNVTTLYSAGGSNHIVAGTGKTLPAFVSSLNSDSVHAKVAAQTEPYEGMLVQFDSVYVINQNADAPSNFGEFAIGKDSSKTVGLRVDDQSNDIGTNFNLDSLASKQKLAFLKGVLYFSFGNWKMLPRNRDDIAGFKSDYSTSVSNVVADNIQFTVYPNPASNQLNLRVVNPGYSLFSQDMDFIITDLTGKRVMELPLMGNVNVLNKNIDISTLAPGVYFCTFHAGNSAKTVKLIKTN